VRRIQGKRELACANCGGRRLVPLTFEYPPIEHKYIGHRVAPVRASLKCASCGRLHNRRPSSVLTPVSAP
jgi:DNA-directed RNA polymerase subunit RPC12/RpoP